VFRSRLQRAIARGLKPGGDFGGALSRLGPSPVETSRDARAICTALARYPWAERPPQQQGAPVRSPLHALTALFQDVRGKGAFDVLREEGLAQLLRIFDERFAEPGEEAGDLMFVLKIFGMYRYRAGVERIVRAARKPLEPDSYMWLVVFQLFDEANPLRDFLCEALREPLPSGLIAGAYLSLANRMAIAGELAAHPFDSAEGKALLETWLTGSEERHAGYAHRAAASLPFISNPQRDQLFALAMDHPRTHVQMEAAWASARLGSEAGVKLLGRFCLDVNHSLHAREYLEELNREDAVPRQARVPGFQATAEMCRWLAHPSEFGRPPDSIELFDTRELHWPPTDDRRRVWLFRYRYQPDTADAEEDVGIGMVGSVTFALFGEATADLPAEDVYALHCCWELQRRNDPRAPRKRTSRAGRAILKKYNPQG
jgi:hypothetical protein